MAEARTCDVNNTSATYICNSEQLRLLFRYYFETTQNTISIVNFFLSLQFNDWKAAIHYPQCIISQRLQIWQQCKTLVLFDEFYIKSPHKKYV
jgi:hypothetical protein